MTNSKDKTVTIHFLGGAGTVTGSKYLLVTGGKKLLIDCGMFQGLKELRLLNWAYPPVNMDEIDFVLLTHGHLDHTGYLPKLVKAGFKGRIIGTAPTLEIAKLILFDSARIQEEEANRANKYGFSKHHPARPFYDTKDVEETLPHFHSAEPEQWISFGEDIRARFCYNGHILGATFIELEAGGKRFVFSGDVGRENDPLMYPPQKPKQADVLFIESTYGDRLHPSDDVKAALAAVINRTLERNGTVIIPGFAVERMQLLLYLLAQLRMKNAIPDVPVYMDSPMGKEMLSVFRSFPQWHKLSEKECAEVFGPVHVVESFRETQTVLDNPQPKIVIAGSGMATGGRVLSYMQKYIGDERSTLLLAGYQADGTRGRKLLEGEKTVKIYGKIYEVNAEVTLVEGLSAHADQGELLRWMSQLSQAPEKIFIVHGEASGSQGLQQKIQQQYGWESTIPGLFDIVEIPAV